MIKSTILMAGRPVGKLGNQLFQYHLISQLAMKFRMTKISFGWNNELKLFNNINAIKGLPNLFSSASIKKSELSNGLTRDIENRIKELSQKKGVLLLEPGILGEVFFDVCYIDPKSIFQISNRDLKEKNAGIAIHFRGKDFKEWNSKAIFEPEYYINALNQLFSLGYENEMVTLHTDDPQHENVVKIRNYLNCKIEINHKKSFFDMVNSKAVIMSPSTYCFWASILGSKKILVHNKEWVISRTEAGEKFWIDLYNGGNEFVSIDYFA